MIPLLTNYFRASFPAVAIQTGDERRALNDVLEAAKVAEKQVIVWSTTEGIVDMNGGRVVPDTNDLMAACQQLRPGTVHVLRDPQTFPFDRDPVLLRTFRDFMANAPSKASTVVIIASAFRPHPCMEKLVVILDAELPTEAELAAIVDGLAKRNDIDQKATPEVLRALGGMTATEAENALSLAFIETGEFSSEVIFREKTKAVKRSGLLEIVAPDPRGLAAVGGLQNLKEWIGRRRRVWTPEGKAFGLRDPKGVLLVGVPGTGKSLAAKAIGIALGVPTLRLDVGALFNSLVGESELRTREALALAEAMSPCVLWVDEIDKGLSGSSGNGSGDSGVGRRVFGSIISWMQERKRPVFFVATANQVIDLPPELLRKGRFDEIFAVDVPTKDERQAIFQLHLDARGVKPNGSDAEVQDMLAATENFTGSEIEAVVDDAMFEAFDAGEPTNIRHLTAAAHATVPLFKTAGEQIRYIREWGATRARAASRGTPTELPPAPPEPEMAVVAVGVVQQDTGHKIQSSPKGEGGKKN